MSTVIYPSPVFGPIRSRRLGISLGINLLPEDGKICSFDCIYCECGYNSDHRAKKGFPERKYVAECLERKLIELNNENIVPDVLTFAGNGEPTCHPDFAGIIDDTIEIRDRYCKNAKISVLSNSTYILRESVFNALKKVDNNILKLDTANIGYIRELDRPQGKYDLDAIIGRMREFDGHVIIQTMFLNGYSPALVDVSNVSDEYVLPWIEKVKYIGPEKVMIYTIDRETPDALLKKATHEELDRIVSLLRKENIEASASY